MTPIDVAQWQAEIASVGEYLRSYGERLPDELRKEQQRVARALAEDS